MVTFPKFIVEDGIIELGRVTFHKQLASDPTKVIGGGFWEWDRDKNKLLLYGESHDFGRVPLASLTNAILETRELEYHTPGRKLLDCEIWWAPDSHDPDWENAKLFIEAVNRQG